MTPANYRSRGTAFLAAILLSVSAAAAPPVPSSEPEQFVRAGAYVYFTADDGIHGRELWRTDGTAEGTALLLDFHPGPESSEYVISRGQCVGDALQFFVRLSPEESALWRTNGDTGSTEQLHVFPHRPSQLMTFLDADEHRCYYNVLNGSDQSGLWASDGTPEGTHLIPVLDHGVLFASEIAFDSDGEFYISSTPGQSLLHSRNRGQSLYVIADQQYEIGTFATLGNQIFYHWKSNTYGSELWTANAAPNSQTLIRDIAEGSGNGVRSVAHAFQGFVPFVANDRVHGDELWRTDGTPEGTRMVADVNPGAAGGDPYNLNPVGDRLVFVAMDAARGREIWVTSGAPDSTYLLHDVNPGAASSTPYALAACGDRLFFSALSADLGEELWVAEGRPMTARLVRDIAPGTDDSAPYYTTALGDKVIFAATSPAHGREPWISDGTAEGTYELLDLYAEPYSNPGSHPAQLVPAGSKLFFVANDLEHGAELWVLDQPGAEPHLVRDIFPGTASANPHNLLYVPAIDRLFFVADDGRFGEELWQSDGSEAGTSWVRDFAQGEVSAAPSDLVATPNGVLYFVAFDGGRRGTGICRLNLDGGLDMMDGTWRIESGWRPRQLCPINADLYFTADDSVHGEELWVANGDGARLVRDILLPQGAGAAPLEPVAWSGRLFFTANDQIAGRSLWHTLPQPPYAVPARDSLPVGRLSYP